MSNNVTLPGTGSVIATDDCGGVEVQKVKLIGGDAGVVGPSVAVRDDGAIVAVLHDLSVAIRNIGEILCNPVWENSSTGAVRVEGALASVSTVSTVSTVTSMSQFSGISNASTIFDFMDMAWTECVRERIV